MAKQLGMINVRGTVGDITYRQTKDGYQVGKKSKLDSAAMQTDIRFDNTRRANAEFGAAGKAGRLIRLAIKQQLDTAKDGRMTPRLLKTLMQVVISDSVSDFGKRRPEKGTLSILEGFDFNIETQLADAFMLPPVTAIDRTTGKLKLTFPGFTPSAMLRVPPGATHFTLVSAGAALDFENNKHESGISESAYLSTSDTPVPGFSLTNTISAGSVLPLILVLGIRFYKEVNNKYYRLQGAEYNSMRIVAVDQI